MISKSSPVELRISAILLPYQVCNSLFVVIGYSPALDRSLFGSYLAVD